jgi:DNA-binding NtrC family response regulator
MEKYNILFIDEDNSQLKKFKRYAKGFERLDVETMEPPEYKEDIINKIVEEDIAAVVCDFDLKEKNTTDYYGSEVIEDILKVKPNFPVFIFTSHKEDALKLSETVHYVYDKVNMNGDKSFLQLIVEEIEKYRSRIDKWKKEFYNLQKKYQEEKLTVREEERLIELDNLIEKTTDNRSSIPGHIKAQQEQELNTLINKTEDILNQIKNSL